MRIGFVVNDTATEKAGYTTIEFARAAGLAGHEVCLLGVADFVYDGAGKIHLLAKFIGPEACGSGEDFVAALHSPETPREKVAVRHLDVLMLRNDPSEDKKSRPWAQTPGILFGQLAISEGVLVLNDPTHLASALTKIYFQHFPEEVRPSTCISREPDEIKAFAAAHDDGVVIKPLDGSGGEGVFLLRECDAVNTNQMIEAVVRDGYCIAQEYLPAAKEGDVRLFVMNGQPLEVNGHYAAIRRVSKSADMRSNMHSGGVSEPAELDDTTLRVVELVRPRLVADGMFLAGLDIVGDKLMEINVFSPGGIFSAQKFTGEDFSAAVIRDIERKLRHSDDYGAGVTNSQLATM